MSHIATYAASLGLVNEHLLKQAMKAVAEKFGGTITSSIRNYASENLTKWEGANIVAGIQTPDVKRGIGVTMKNGTLKFIGDSYGCQESFLKLQKEIELAYTKLAIAAVLKQSGYELEVSAQPAGTVFIGRKR